MTPCWPAEWFVDCRTFGGRDEPGALRYVHPEGPACEGLSRHVTTSGVWGALRRREGDASSPQTASRRDAGGEGVSHNPGVTCPEGTSLPRSRCGGLFCVFDSYERRGVTFGNRECHSQQRLNPQVTVSCSPFVTRASFSERVRVLKHVEDPSDPPGRGRRVRPGPAQRECPVEDGLGRPAPRASLRFAKRNRRNGNATSVP